MEYRYIYVKSGGTASVTNTSLWTTSPKTGSWSTAFSSTSEYVGSIIEANSLVTSYTTYTSTYKLVICVSDQHVEAYTAATGDAYSLPMAYQLNYPLGDSLVSVDDSNIDRLKKGATLSTTVGNYAGRGLPAFWYIYGLKFIEQKTESDSPEYGVNPIVACNFLENCEIVIGDNTVTGASYETLTFYPSHPSGSTGHLTFKDSIIDFSGSSTNSHIDFVLGTKYSFIGCIFKHTTSTTSPFFSSTGGGTTTSYEKPNLYFLGCDFTLCNRPFLHGGYSSGVGYDGNLFFEGCKFASNNQTPVTNVVGGSSIYHRSYHPVWTMLNCQDSSGSVFPITRIQYVWGYVDSNNAYYRNEGAEWNYNEDKYSIVYSIDSSATLITSPHVFTLEYLSSDWLDMSKSYTFNIYIYYSGTLTKDDFWVDAYYTYRDSQDSYNVQIKTVSTRETVLIPGTGTSISSSTQQWTQYGGGSSSTNSKVLQLSTTGDGSVGPILFYVGIRAGKTVRVCPKIEY